MNYTARSVNKAADGIGDPSADAIRSFILAFQSD
jgi:hypothetical protein